MDWESIDDSPIMIGGGIIVGAWGMNLARKLGIEFTRDDTLAGVRREYDAIAAEQKVMEQLYEDQKTEASKKVEEWKGRLGGDLKRCTYALDEEKGHFFTVFSGKGDEIRVPVINGSNAELWEGMTQLNKKSSLLYSKFNIIRNEYRRELKVKLNDAGIPIVKGIDLDRALRAASFDINDALEYAVAVVFTDLKVAMYEKEEVKHQLWDLKHELGSMSKNGDKGCVGQTEKEISLKIDRLCELKAFIAFTYTDLKERLLADAGVVVTYEEIRVCLMRKKWNVDDAYEALVEAASRR